MSLKSQRRIAASILNVGTHRVWIDPERREDVELAITRSEIRRLIHEGAIKAAPIKGESRWRAKRLKEKRRKGLRRGPGTRKGGRYATISRKSRWMSRIRAIRERLRLLRARRIITPTTYRELYLKAKGGEFKSISDMERYISQRGLRRKTFG
ncbi:MAG: 50S ribosomal protein L19e [Candidatus Bathyarchaeia archaeon]|nr:50S ribosomal protein L19e [Candidatus Bathyarchaeota archaeon]